MKVSIMRGVPGSGKSTFVQKLKDENTVVCSADDYVYVDGVFQPSLLNEAHKKCFRKYVEALDDNTDHIIVDNTNLKAWETSPYIMIASLYRNTEVTIHDILCNYEVAFTRQTHGVPRSQFDRMCRYWEDCDFPPFWKITKHET